MAAEGWGRAYIGIPCPTHAAPSSLLVALLLVSQHAQTPSRAPPRHGQRERTGSSPWLCRAYLFIRQGAAAGV